MWGKEILRSRRRFLTASALAVAGFLLNNQQNTPERKVFDVLGFVVNPYVGGGENPERAISDTKQLGGKNLLVLEPNERFIESARNSGIQLITRLYLKDNTFDKDRVEEVLRTASTYPQRLIVQPFNEVNLPEIETGGRYIGPAEHIVNNFIPAAKVVEQYGGLTLLTPLAQGAPIDEYIYLKDMLLTLRANAPLEWIRNNIGIGLHNYIFQPGEDFWYRIKAVNPWISRFMEGTYLPLHITEAGLYQHHDKPFPEETFSNELMRIIDSPIPPEITNLQSFCIWILASLADRPLNRPDLESLGTLFEPAALRKKYRLSLGYGSLNAYAGERQSTYA